MKLNAIMLLFSLLAVSPVKAGAQYFQADLMKKRQASKAQTRWTLTDWLAQKQRLALMDLWLSQNRSETVFEMDLGASRQELSVETHSAGVRTENDFDSTRYTLSFFIFMFGLQGEYLDSDEGYTQTSAHVNLRLLGSSQQNTRFNIKYGLRKRELNAPSSEEWQQQYAGAELNLYVTDFFGLNGEYRHFFKDRSTAGVELSGAEWSGGGFLEYGLFRVFARYRMEKEEQLTSSGAPTSIERSGLEYGARLYF